MDGVAAAGKITYRGKTEQGAKVELISFSFSFFFSRDIYFH